jgi:hypothetical protein
MGNHTTSIVEGAHSALKGSNSRKKVKKSSLQASFDIFNSVLSNQRLKDTMATGYSKIKSSVLEKTKQCSSI